MVHAEKVIEDSANGGDVREVYYDHRDVVWADDDPQWEGMTDDQIATEQLNQAQAAEDARPPDYVPPIVPFGTQGAVLGQPTVDTGAVDEGSV
jgi:hypothetical protein